MSKETMERIVGRAVTNREYRERLLARPEEALKGYHLTDEEMCRVKDWTNRTFEILIHDLERQVDGLRFDGSAGFRVPDDDRPRPPGKRISPAELRLLVTTCLPELCGAALHECLLPRVRTQRRVEVVHQTDVGGVIQTLTLAQ